MTQAEKWVSEYAGMSIIDVSALCYFDYLVLLRDAVIYKLSQTDSGREYLDKCWIAEQTKPDRVSLKEKMARRDD